MADMLDEYAEANGLTRAEAVELLRPVLNGTQYLRIANMPWWRRRYYAIAPSSPFTLRKTLRRWTRLGILYAMHKERERRTYLACTVGIDDTEWSDW